jgi:hypothetical protein
VNRIGWVVAVLALSLSGCAWVTHREVSESNDDKADGIRYYQASPYLLVHSDGKGGIVWKIVYLPDQTKKMVAKSVNFLAKTESALTFDNGVLTSSKDVLTADTVPKAIVEAVQKAASSFLAMARAEVSEQEIPRPHLYKIVVTGAVVEFYGGPADVPIKVTVHPEVP